MIRILRIILATIGSLFIIGLLAALAVNALPLFLFLSPFFLCIIVALVASATGSAPRRRAMVVLSYLDQAVRLNLPLPPMLTAAAASEPHSTAKLLRSLRNNLESGMTIADSLRQAAPAVGRRKLALIDSAQRLGRLPQMLHRIINENRERRLEDPTERSFLSTYPPILAAVILTITGMFMVFVMPKFQQIFLDFHTELPGATRLLLFISYWFTEEYGWFICLLLVLAVAYLLPKWASSPNIFKRSRDWSDVCRVMADALEAGLPLDAALRQAGELSIASSVQKKLRRWAAAAEQGQSPPDAARAADMPALITGMTTTGLAATNMAEVFRFLGRYYSSKFSRLAILLRGAAVPAFVFFFGGVVAFVALSLFAPLISLISSVSGYTGAL
jgi:type II secretory pathway component PulF